jgi:hypothetical protein
VLHKANQFFFNGPAMRCALWSGFFGPLLVALGLLLCECGSVYALGDGVCDVTMLYLGPGTGIYPAFDSSAFRMYNTYVNSSLTALTVSANTAPAGCQLWLSFDSGPQTLIANGTAQNLTFPFPGPGYHSFNAVAIGPSMQNTTYAGVLPLPAVSFVSFTYSVIL